MIDPASTSHAVPSATRERRLAVQSSSARCVTIEGRERLFFGGCGYLALGHDPRVLAALLQGAQRHGISNGASRETTGNVVEHVALERELAGALGLEAALLLPEGASANAALFESLAGEAWSVFADRDAHPTLTLGLRAGGFEATAYDPGEPERLVEAIGAARGEPLIATDGVFPIAGRAAPLAELLARLPEGRGLLVVDDCHGFGVLGPRGRGSLERAHLSDPRVVVTGTLSKALGTYGGFVAGTRARIAQVRERSGLYAGTTPPPPALACAARAALAIHVGEPLRHAEYALRTARFATAMRALGLAHSALDFPVCAFELDSHERMERVHDAAAEEGVLLPLIRYGGQRSIFRIVWNAAHTDADLERLTGVLARVLP